MSKFVLITGGAGFIGQHLARALVGQGFKIRILDNFSSQVHENCSLSFDLLNQIEVIKADVRDLDAIKHALCDIECVVHLAAETGTGQSMYEIEHYFSVNVQGTALLLDLLQNDDCGKNVRSIVLASSRAVYGEGAYHCLEHGLIFPEQRLKEQITKGSFDPFCPSCGSKLSLEKTIESAPFKPMSMYGLTKQVQEQAILLYARTRGINAFALRFQNVYGPGQSLKNPYTGILAIFSNLARQNLDIEVYEDGLESRDFVYIDDVVESIVSSINYSSIFQGPINIGSGVETTVIDVAERINTFFGGKGKIKVNGKFRFGDIRHNIANLELARETLNFSPKVDFATGLINFLNWASTGSLVSADEYKRSVKELELRGLMGINNF